MNTTLCARSFNSWIMTVDTYISNQHDDMMNLKNKVEQISELGYNLTGAGGTAIKLFYREAHIPVIQFYQILAAEIRNFFQKYKRARQNLDSYDTAYIERSFLENELSNTLKNFQNKVTSMTDQTNYIINNVADIVSLPKIDDTLLLSSIDQSIKKVQTTSDELQAFDYSQLQIVQTINQDLSILKTYISKLSNLINTDGFEMTKFKSGDMNKYSWYKNLKNTMNTKENIPNEIMKELRSEQVIEQFNGIIDFFGNANQILTYSDNTITYLKSGLALAYGATNYLSSNPLLKVNLKPGNKFTVSTTDSWKAKSGYSNPIANFINKMQKGLAPTNYFKRQLSSFLKSYNNPSSVAKHFLGFQKNVTASTKLETLTRYTAERAKYGTKELLKDITSKAGFTKTSKAIPFIGTGIVITSNLDELTKAENIDKSQADKLAQASTGAIMDLSAAAGGAKFGATLGFAAGGPLGAAIGGAIGAAGGVFISSKLKEPVTDFVGESVSNIEKGVEKAFKSINSWFK